MNQQQSPETEFARRLRAELKAIVAERAAQTPTHATTTRPAWRRRGPRLGLAAATTAAVAAVVLIVSAGGSDTPAAFAVEPRPEGQLSVEIRSLEDPRGLEAALVEAGIPASVNYLAAGMICKEPRFKPVPWPKGARTIVAAKVTGTGPDGGPPFVVSGPLRFIVSRDAVGPDQTLVITASPSAKVPEGFGSKGEGFFGPDSQVKVAEGTVAPCEPIPVASSE